MDLYNNDRMVTLFALLALLCIAFLVVVVPVAIWAKLRGGLPESWQPLRSALGEVALPLGFAVALVTSLGSLYLSERLKLPPCKLCWYQRICMYPQVVLLGVASLRRDAAVKWYSLPLVGIGMVIATWHYLVERFPDSVSSVCTNDVPCETVWIWKFHFLSIPGMAWVGFATIAALVLLARPALRGASPNGTVVGTEDAPDASAPATSDPDESDLEVDQ